MRSSSFLNLSASKKNVFTLKVTTQSSEMIESTADFRPKSTLCQNKISFNQIIQIVF